jgi:hypothetical protein
MNQIDKILPSKEEVDELLSEKIRGSQIKKSHWHDAGAYGRCSYCGRYSDNMHCLDSTFVCSCGSRCGYSGSFRKPDKNSIWNESK